MPTTPMTQPMRTTMMMRMMTLSLAALATSLAMAADAVLFEANFNDGLEATTARGGGAATASAYAEVNAGAGRHGQGLDLTARGAFVAWPAAGNIDLDQGTLRFWFRPAAWPASKNFFARLFATVYDLEKRGTTEARPGALMICKTEKSRDLEFHNFKSWRQYKFAADVSSWQTDQWVHVVITWEKDGQRRLFLDGELSGEDAYFRGADQPAELVFGSPYFGHDCHGMVDEILILNRALAAAEVRADLSAEPAPAPVPAALAAGEYAPVPLPEVVLDRQLYTGETVLTAFYAAEPVVLDGVPDEPFWQQAPPVPPMLTRKGQPPKAASQVRILYDQKNIYFGCDFEEPEIDQLRVDLDQHDQPIYSNDCLELVLDTADSPESTFHLVANMIGGIYDARNGDKRFLNARQAVAKGRRHDGRWTLEFAVPFADLGCHPPFPGETWGVRVCRERYPVSEVSSYPACLSGPFGARSFLARLEFRGSLQAGSGLQMQLVADDFRPGGNRAVLTIANPGAAAATAQVTAAAVTAAGPRPPALRETVELAPGKTTTVTAVIPADAETIQIALQAAVNGEVVWRAGIKPGFQPPPVAPAELLRLLRLVDGDLLSWEAVNPAAAEGLRRNVERLRGVLQGFQERQAAAVAEGRVLERADCDRVAAEVNGFKQWLDARRLLVWEVSPWENGAAGDLPATDRPAGLHFRQGGNEWEFRALAIAGVLPGGGMDWRLAVADLYGEDGSRVNRANLVVYQAPFVRNNARQLVTDPLIENDADAFTVLPGQSRRFWLALHSRDMAPGRYTTTITVKPLDPLAVPRELWPVIPVTVEILPFTLPPTHEWPLDTFIWHGGMTPCQSEIPSLEFLHRHHISWVSTDRHRYDVGKPANGTLRNRAPAGAPTAPGEAYFDPANITANDDFLRLAVARRMKVLFAWNICRNPEWVKLMSEHLIDLGFTYDQFIFSGMGDEFRAAALPKYLPFHEQARAVAPRVRWMCTLITVPPPEGCTEEQLDEVMQYIKTPILFNSHLWPRDQERARRMSAWLQRHPDLHPWIYRCSMSAQTCPLLSYYRLAPLNARLCGVRGLAYWAMSSITGKRVERHGKMVQVTPDGFFDQADPEAQLFDGLTYWHPRKNIIPTKRLMALVEGLEDVAMIHLLEQKTPNHQLIQDKTLLELHQAESQAALNAWRQQMLDALAK